jgi:hypothetical protein
MLCFAAIVSCSCANNMQEKSLLQMPVNIDMANSSIVRVNPFNGPQVFDQFLVDIWRLGDSKLQHVHWNVSEWSGLVILQDLEAEFQLGLTPELAGSTAVQYYNGSFGANLNLFSNPIQPNQSLATITIEYNWSPQTRVSPWAIAGSYIDLSLLYQVPTAKRQGIAIYSSWSLGLLHIATQKFVWFETALFDLGRPLGGDAVWLDIISNNVIIHSVLSNQTSLFHEMQPDSSLSVSNPFSGLKLFHFTINENHIHAAMVAANSKFSDLNLSTVAAEWQLVHTNVEVEGAALSACGHSLQDLSIRQVLQ